MGAEQLSRWLTPRSALLACLPRCCVPTACPTRCPPHPPQARGVQDILAVDVSPAMIAALQQRVGAPSTLGNDACVRTWLGDVTELPSFQAREQLPAVGRCGLVSAGRSCALVMRTHCCQLDSPPLCRCAAQTRRVSRCGFCRSPSTWPPATPWFMCNCAAFPVLDGLPQGPFDVAIFNAVFGNLLDQHDALVRTCFLLKPGRRAGWGSSHLCGSRMCCGVQLRGWPGPHLPPASSAWLAIRVTGSFAPSQPLGDQPPAGSAVA